MTPSLDFFADVSQGPLPVKAIPTRINGVDAVAGLQLDQTDKHDTVLKVFQAFIADLCEQFGGGHPGGAMGMAAIGVALYKYVMQYSPRNASYFNRDRFVLSNGHTCLFQYLFMHLVGFESMTVEQLKSYHSKRHDSLCPGHPEIENEGIEVTTGPLGQGVANAVGLAMATKHLAATYNKPGYGVVSNMTWCMIGDACLQEGIGLEAVSLAGHWKLNNLAIIYDNNNITCDGSADVACSDDVNMRMQSFGWNVIDVFDGDHNIAGIVQALLTARISKKPTFINIRTIIAVGSTVANNAKTHGSAFGAAEVAKIKEMNGLDPEKHFHIPKSVYNFFADVADRGVQLENAWRKSIHEYTVAYPELAAEFLLRMEGRMVQDWRKFIPTKDQLPRTPTASRKSAGLICNPLAENLRNFLIGTADLTPSVNMTYKRQVDFQSPEFTAACGMSGDYTGRYIHYGIREHAMCAISNGLAAFNKGTFLPVTSTFFMFYLYAAPAVRMGALQGLQQIHVATHDSIGTGEDGPTHQPIALAALYRAMPNLLYMRPCDGEEVAGAFIMAIEASTTPSLISLSRQALPQYFDHSDRQKVTRGAYVFIEDEKADVTLIASGSEMVFAMNTRDVLAKQNVRARIVSFPCQRLFEQQPKSYKQSVLKYKTNAPIVVIEAYAINGWERYADAGISMKSFGKSLPGATAYEYFGFDPAVIAPKIQAFVEEVRKEGIQSLRGEFRDLNGVMGYGFEH